MINSHYDSLLNFVDLRQSRRFSSLLQGNVKAKKKFYTEFSHRVYFREGVVIEINPKEHSPQKIFDILVQKGAPETCYLISDNSKFSDTSLDLLSALSDTVGFGAATFISCTPNKLAFFESGDMGERFILLKR